ncbi:MAG TPA: hypothetical protein VJ965_10080 [Anaerolineales bacterium]|nr:hypothetical protein [Anaerolineales bacterium]
MDESPQAELDRDVRHHIYTTFCETARPPSSLETAAELNLTIAEANQSLDRLAGGHQIALTPGSHTIWMAHPFSALPTNFSADVGGKRYWGN